MMYERIYADWIAAKKARDLSKAKALEPVYVDMQSKMKDKLGAALTDAEELAVLQKNIKTLEDSIASYEKAGRDETVVSLKIQLVVVKEYLPKLMSEDEIRDEINKLEDKSMKSVMAHFKANFAGKVDMGLVSKIARGA